LTNSKSDLRIWELFRDGSKVRLQAKPFFLLAALITKSSSSANLPRHQLAALQAVLSTHRKDASNETIPAPMFRPNYFCACRNVYGGQLQPN
jgi:hypothetical protein